MAVEMKEKERLEKKNCGNEEKWNVEINEKTRKDKKRCYPREDKGRRKGKEWKEGESGNMR